MRLFGHRRQAEPRNLADVATMFGRARVYDVRSGDEPAMRILDVEGTWQSGCYLGSRSHDLVFRYHRRFAGVLMRHHLPGCHALMLGGGGFSFPAWLLAHDPASRVDVIEIDPTIIDLAERWLALSQLSADERARLRIVCADAVEFLEWQSAQARSGQALDRAAPYGLIVNDLFAAERPTRELMEPDGVRLIHDALAPEGLYLANVVSALKGSRSRPLRRVVSSLREGFAHVRVMPLGADEPRIADNNVVIASDADLSWLT